MYIYIDTYYIYFNSDIFAYIQIHTYLYIYIFFSVPVPTIFFRFFTPWSLGARSGAQGTHQNEDLQEGQGPFCALCALPGRSEIMWFGKGCPHLLEIPKWWICFVVFWSLIYA